MKKNNEPIFLLGNWSWQNNEVKIKTYNNNTTLSWEFCFGLSQEKVVQAKLDHLFKIT